jgi:hypothetical protein
MKNQKGRKFALWGAWLQLGLVCGLGGTIIGMINAFGKIAENEIEDPALLANDISFALITTAIGLVPALLGLIFLGIALFGKKYRAAWFFWFLIIYSCFLALYFPVGTIMGLALIIYLIWNKDEFIKSKSD